MAGTPRDERDPDPARDVGDAWQWGLETSRVMGERLLELYSQVGTTAFTRVAGGGGGDELRQVRRDIERWVDLSVDVFDRAFSVMRRLADDGNGNGSGAGPPPDRVSLIGLAGGTCVGELWLHNLADGERPAPVLRSTGLLSADGSSIPSSAIRFEADPAAIDGRGRRNVSVLVEVPESALPGIYHGQIVSDASPDAPVALRLDVRRG